MSSLPSLRSKPHDSDSALGLLADDDRPVYPRRCLRHASVARWERPARNESSRSLLFFLVKVNNISTSVIEERIPAVKFLGRFLYESYTHGFQLLGGGLDIFHTKAN